jgi:hypothetical protein
MVRGSGGEYRAARLHSWVDGSFDDEGVNVRTYLMSLSALAAAGAIALLVACSGSNPSSVTPAPASFAFHRHFASHDSCPATGPIKYVADFVFNVINIYVGKFAGQAPCGQIASGLLNGPAGLYVQPESHDLYVANKDGRNVLVFHRGQLTPYNTYTDPTVQLPIDVTVANDGTVLASNYTNLSQTEPGSISTWVGGPNGGTFVGNFLMTNSLQGGFITAKGNGTIYFDDVDRGALQGFLWHVACPAGACGLQIRAPQITFQFPGGMAFDDTGDLIVADSFAATADTFELPNPVPSTFPLVGEPFALAINRLDHHLFVSDGFHNDAVEYSYPKGTLVGSVTGAQGGNVDGVAVDP